MPEFFEEIKSKLEEEKAEEIPQTQIEVPENIELRDRMEKSREFEASLVLENPELVGINFDQDFIVDSRGLWDKGKCIDYLKARGDIVENQLDSLTEGELQKRAEEERNKLSRFDEYFEQFKGKVEHIRINPAGEASPVSLSQAIEKISEDEFSVNISSDFLDQLKSISENCKDTTLVVPFYDHRREKAVSGDMPKKDQEIEQYIAVCEKIVEECGGKVVLEIGNEVNVSKKTGIMFRDRLQHLSEVNPEEYSKFFVKVANRLKEKNPEVKLAMSGVACYDPTYLKTVLEGIKKEETNKKLVDRASFHPYRENPEEGSIEVEDGQFKMNELDYKKQVEEMKSIGQEYGIDMRVGEINFPFSDPEQQRKLKKAIDLTFENGMQSLIYPGVNTL